MNGRSQSRRGYTSAHLYGPAMQHWVEQWHAATQDVWVEHEAYNQAEYDAYLAWYLLRTRVRVTHVPEQVDRRTPSFSDTYPVHRDQASAHAVRTTSYVYSISESTKANTLLRLILTTVGNFDRLDW